MALTASEVCLRERIQKRRSLFWEHPGSWIPLCRNFPGLMPLVSNVFAYLSKDETLAGIRAKGAIIRP